jgi:iron(III) transport system substrate-binding protein
MKSVRVSTSLILGIAASILAAPAIAAEVNLYTIREPGLIKPMLDAFTEKTGIRTNTIFLKDGLAERVAAEGANSPADILMTVDVGNLVDLADKGLTQPIKSAALDAAVPANLRDPEGRWFALSLRGRLVYVAKAHKLTAIAYEDLADPKWKGRLLIRSSTNVYNQSLAGSILAAHGEKKTEEWARGIVANLARRPQGGDSDQIKAVAAGAGDIAVSNTYYFGRIAGSDKPEDKAIADKVGVFFPNQNDRGTHVNISGAGVLKNAPNKDSAVKFLEYLVSPSAQKIFAEGNYEYPVSKVAEVAPVIASWGPFKEDTLNAAVFGKNNEEALKIMDRAGWK